MGLVHVSSVEVRRWKFRKKKIWEFVFSCITSAAKGHIKNFMRLHEFIIFKWSVKVFMRGKKCINFLQRYSSIVLLLLLDYRGLYSNGYCLGSELIHCSNNY